MHVLGLCVFDIVLPPLLGVTCATVVGKAAVFGDAVVSRAVLVCDAVVGAIAVVATANFRSSDKRSS